MSTQTVSVTGSSAQSSAVGSTKIRFVSNVSLHYAVGANPTAYTSGNCEMIPANTIRYINMGGLNNKIAVIALSGGSTGICTITDIGAVYPRAIPGNVDMVTA